MASSEPAIRQRAELTFKHNVQNGRHGWLRLTPAYSVKLVRDIVADHPDAKRVFDPFSGTGTTPLCAAEFGHQGTSTEINPFLVWLGNVKTAAYSKATLKRLETVGGDIARSRHGAGTSAAEAPPINNIERWWSPTALRFLCETKGVIDRYGDDLALYDLLRVSFCRTLIGISNAAFNHQSMSFKKGSASSSQISLIGEDEECRQQFHDDVQRILRSAEDAPSGSASVVLGDARNLNAIADLEPFDLLVTSPPYPNRMSYIRELRPYMYWLSYLLEAREAGELDWDAIGGTWGIATSRLGDWKPDPKSRLPEYLEPILSEVRSSHEKNGPLMANYIHKYFEDIQQHLRALGRHLRPGAMVYYIVGNSTFYGHVVPVERLYADMLSTAGFERTGWEVVRKRNSKKELFEFSVTGRWSG